MLHTLIQYKLLHLIFITLKDCFLDFLPVSTKLEKNTQSTKISSLMGCEPAPPQMIILNSFQVNTSGKHMEENSQWQMSWRDHFLCIGTSCNPYTFSALHSIVRMDGIYRCTETETKQMQYRETTLTILTNLFYSD